MFNYDKCPYTEVLEEYTYYTDLTELELVYLAGLLEGEGYFGLMEIKSRKNPLITVEITMVDLDIIERFALLVGSKVYTRKAPKSNYKEQYHAKITGRKALCLMRLLYPYMGRRRRERIEFIMQNARFDKKPSCNDDMAFQYSR